MSRKILVDAVYPGETRLVVCENGIVEEFEYQNSSKKSIKGNIYLARVTRVEPSLQSAFVDFGGLTDGFLPIHEIHHEYYQIPAADKERLQEAVISEAVKNAEEDLDQIVPLDSSDDNDAPEEIRRPSFYKNYKVQEVIKVGQVMLVQVKKEGRGRKGATLTTYISLAGRYSVLMPNAINSGGVSRKVSDQSERTRLKKIMAEMSDKIGLSASIIVRTAGEGKTKTEIKRDLNYLMNIWNKIRECTLASKAPAFIYEEGDVVQKAIRDLYTVEVDEILIEGEEAYNNARSFMELLLPKHMSKITLYTGVAPIFMRFYNIEKQLGLLYDNVVQLKSGGYLVINQTEALVAIDVNSGKANKERDVERTALKINVEAAKEIARQLRLRDLSGLIVIDFIDMEGLKNRRAVEQAFKIHVMERDKAKINITKISILGMLEVSRQRLRQNFLDAHTSECSNCVGKGRVRNIESTSLAIFRAAAAEASTLNEKSIIKIAADEAVIMNIMNNNRKNLIELEKRANIIVHLSIDKEAGNDGFFIERMGVMHGDVSYNDISNNVISPSDAPVKHDDFFESNLDDAPEDHTNSVVANVKEDRTKRSKSKWKKKHIKKHDKSFEESGEVAREHHLQIEISESPIEVPVTQESNLEQQERQSRRKKARRTRSRVKINESGQLGESVLEQQIDENHNERISEKQANQSFLKEIWKKIVE